MSISQRLISLSYKKNIPLVVNFELTKRCVNDCIFCYIDEKQTKELNFDEITKILFQLKESGCMFLTLTGGEPFLREDFCDIVKISKNLNFYIRVFSSFAFNDKKYILQAYKNGLRDIEVSLHGKRDTHNKTAGNDCFDITIENILFAKKLGYRVIIKTPITKVNIKDLLWVKDFADKNNMTIKFDPIITPSNNGIKKNYEFQITPKDVKYLIEIGLFDFMLPKNARNANKVEYFSCGALKNLCAISCEGHLYPCLSFPYKIGDLKEKDFLEIWNSYEANKLRNDLSQPPKSCLKCDMIDICSWCVGVSYLETKTLNYVYKTACSLTSEFKKKLGG